MRPSGPGIYISALYEDADAIQLSIAADNASFSGVCEPYFDRQSLEEIAKELMLFPKHQAARYSFDFAEFAIGPTSYLSFFVADSRGRIGVECMLRGGSANYKDTGNFFVFTEAAQVNEAGRLLQKLASDTSVNIYIRQER